MTKLARLALALSVISGLISCSAGGSNRATPERLAALRDTGVDQKALDRTTKRFDKTVSKRKSMVALADAYAGDAISDPKDTNLAALFQGTLEHHPKIGRAAQGINRANAERLNAIFGYLPQVNVNYSMNQISQEVVQTDNEVFAIGKAEYPVTNFGVELRQPIFDLSRIYGIQAKSTARTAAEARYLAAVQEAVYETFDAYVVAAQSKSRLQELGKQASIISSQAVSEEALTDSGLEIESTLRTINAERASIEADMAVESARYAKALGDLSYMSGIAVRDVQPLKLPSGILGSERKTTPEKAVAAAVENNPALLASTVSVVESELTRRQAIAADFSPVVDAFARYEDETREGSRFGGGSQTRDTTVGFRVTLPIFNGKGQGYSMLEQTVDVREAALEYYGQKRQLETEIATTLARMSELSQAVAAAQKVVGITGANSRAESERNEMGESADIAVLARRLTEAEARERLSYQQFEYLRAWGQLQYLTGAQLSNQGF